MPQLPRVFKCFYRERNIGLIDANQRCNFSTLAAQQWLAIRLQMMGVVMVTGVAFTAVLEKLYGSQSMGIFFITCMISNLQCYSDAFVSSSNENLGLNT